MSLNYTSLQLGVVKGTLAQPFELRQILKPKKYFQP